RTRGSRRTGPAPGRPLRPAPCRARWRRRRRTPRRRAAPPRSSPRLPQHGRQQRDGSLLVERLVAVAALGRLHAGRAPARTGTRADRLEGGLQEPPAAVEPAFHDPGPAGVAVVE